MKSFAEWTRDIANGQKEDENQKRMETWEENGLTVHWTEGKAYFECRSCGKEFEVEEPDEWTGEVQVCGGSERCIP